MTGVTTQQYLLQARQMQALSFTIGVCALLGFVVAGVAAVAPANVAAR